MPHNSLQALRSRLNTTILGAKASADLLLTALLARGHALLTGPPGIGKTTLAHTLADSVGGTFKRLQFTPDLLPSDILGYNLYHQQNGAFDFVAGPVFSNLLLADEINRASPRTQSALLEAMNEHQVSIDGETKALPNPFLVVATQNDTSATGTFPLPEPQLDRFLLSIPMTLPSEETQLEVLRLHAGRDPNSDLSSADSAVLSLEDLTTLQAEAAALPLSDHLQRYLLALCQSTRSLVGHDHAVSVRASLALQAAAQAYALLDGEVAVHPDHLQAVFPHVLRHRLLSADSPDPAELLQDALDQTPVP
ncbi:MAG: AAA domain-containing protein [Akkermansiaceae bacterium]|nr:AAA domain-containing protein [Akkermansiaceae bacterium]NNM30751.1 AAA domain-containing protein [Akkermansiaceae bacterium]